MSRVTGLPGVLIGLVAVLACGAGVARGGVISFLNDYEGWLKAAGGVAQEIDFETLPNGNPSQAGFPITEHFNYTDQGVTFSSVPTDIDVLLIIVGNDVGGFGLAAFGNSLEVGIVSTFVEPAFAAGVFFPGITTFSIFSEDGVLLGEEMGSKYPDPEGFVGFVSDIPIAYTLNTRDSTQEAIISYVFVPIPEPTTCTLFCLAFAIRRTGAFTQRRTDK